MRTQLLPALRILLALTLLTGIAYPLAITGLAQLTMADRADGSLLVRDGEVVGSRLQAQAFDSDGYFHPRPGGYDGAATGGSSLGPTNPELFAGVETRVADYRARNSLADTDVVPVDAVTESGSGLDPHISIANAQLQTARVAAARGLPPDEVGDLVAEHTSGRTLGILGEPHVNVLKLNLALDARTSS
jgi:potassium-transporting ATPase KdpC subunit